MNWFGGSIREAIGLAKSKDAIFVVYIHDSSEASKTTDENLAREEIASVLSSKKFVAIKLENGTESANQFSQIYPVVIIPSLYFISGSTGIPVEILGGAISREKLKENLDKFIGEEQVETDKSPDKSQPTPEEMQVDEPKLPSTSCREPTPSAEMSDKPQGSSVPSTAPADTRPGLVDSTEQEMDEPMAEDKGTDGEAPIKESAQSLAEKQERAKALLAEKQSEKIEEKVEEEKKKEIDRRTTGQEIAKRKRQMYEEELMSAARERKKEKDDDRVARERVRAQIAADKREREQRAALLQGEASAPTQEPSVNVPPAASNRNPNVTRLKFKLPDGSSSIAQFPVNAMLAEVNQHVQQQLVSSSNFTLSSTMHHRPFTPEDHHTSLSDLGLVPSAIIVVLTNPYGTGSRSLTPSRGGAVEFFWLLLSPITFILGFMRQIFSRGTRTPRPPPPSGDDTQNRSGQAPQQRPSTAYRRQRTPEGNVHRLRNINDEDDNNTWNGNSTQQM